MSRRDNGAAERAAQQASEAARVLQQRSQESRQEAQPAEPEPKAQERTDVRILTPRNEPRRRAMEEIEARDLRTKGMDLPGIQPEPEPAPKVEDPAPPKPEDMLKGGKFSQPDPEPAPQAAAPEAEAPKTVRVKVDGEEFDAPETEVEEAGGVKAYQIQRASENRLKKAGEVLAEARQVEARMAEFAKQQAPAKPAEPSDAQFIQSKVDAIRFGSPEESAAALQEILQRVNKPVDQNAITEQVRARIRHDSAVERFDKEFADVASNPMLLRLTVALRNERVAQFPQGQAVDWWAFYSKIGNEVRSVAGKPSQPATTSAVTSGTPSQAPSEKEARKASIVNLPTAAARAEQPKEEKPESRDDILNQMRKKRGIPTG